MYHSICVYVLLCLYVCYNARITANWNCQRGIRVDYTVGTIMFQSRVGQISFTVFK